MKKVALLFSLSFLIRISIAFAQSPDILWSKAYGNVAHDKVSGAYEMLEGGFIAAGTTQDTSSYDYNGWIFITDESGNLISQKDYGENSLDEMFNCMRNCPDNGFILCGDAERSDSYLDIYTTKIDSTGSVISNNRFGNSGSYYNGYCVDAFLNGDFIIVGRILSEGSNYTFMRTFPNLSLMYGNVGDWEWTDVAYGVSTTYDNGYVVVGTTNSWGENTDNIFVLKMSPDGYYENHNIIGSSGEEEGYWIEQTSDSCYILCGSTTYLSQDRDIYIVKLNQNLDILWTKRYGSTYHDKGIKIIENVEGGYTCVATAHNERSFDIYVLRLDEYGDTLWTKYLGDPDLIESASSIAQTTDGGYIISGNQQVTSTNLNAYLVKLQRDPYKIDSYHRFNLDLEIPDLGVAKDILDIGSSPKLSKILTDNIISSVVVKIDTVIHPFISDLTLILSHNGITDTLIYKAGTSGEDIINCNLSDASNTLILGGEAPFNGSFKPHSPLSVFKGIDPLGDWILTIKDDVAGNSGTLHSWGLKLYFDQATGISSPAPVLPVVYKLCQNYPNPFNPITTIKYEIPSDGNNQMLNVKLVVFDILGREVAILVNERQNSGYYEANWNGSDQASGVYFYKLNCGNFTETKKMILLN